MPTFLVSYRMVCNGSVSVDAADRGTAEALVQEMPLSKLGGEAEDSDVEIVSIDGVPVGEDD